MSIRYRYQYIDIDDIFDMSTHPITYASRYLFSAPVSWDIAVTWHTVSPNRSPSFEVSAILPVDEFNDIRGYAEDSWSALQQFLLVHYRYLYGKMCHEWRCENCQSRSPRFYSTCTPMTCQSHVAENSFTQPLKANWNVVSRQQYYVRRKLQYFLGLDHCKQWFWYEWAQEDIVQGPMI